MGGGQQIPGVGMNITPNAMQPALASMEPGADTKVERPSADETAQARQMARAFGVAVDESRPRVVMRFPSDPTTCC